MQSAVRHVVDYDAMYFVLISESYTQTNTRPGDNVFDHISQVAARRARLVLGWVTVRGYIVLIRNRPLRPTQPPTLSGTGNKYRLRGSAAWPGS